MKTLAPVVIAASLLCGALAARAVASPLQYYTGLGRMSCPCFVGGDQVGVVFDVPVGAYPIEVTAVGIAWLSSFGGVSESFEGAIHVYPGALPDPGAPVYTRTAPVFTAGQTNEFSLLDSLSFGVSIGSGPFTVTLEFANDNAGNNLMPSVAHDGNGCQAGRNVVYTATGGWQDAKALGFTGDFVFYIRYRTINSVVATAEPMEVNFLNVPDGETRCATAYLANVGSDTLLIKGIHGGGVDPFAIDTMLTDHRVPPGGRASFNLCAHNNHSSKSRMSFTVLSNAYNSPTTYVMNFEPAVQPTGVDGMRHPLEITAIVPNPFNPGTAIHFHLPAAGDVDAVVYSVDGKRVRTLARHAFFPAGEGSMAWNGRDDGGSPVASGVYLLRLQTRQGTRTARLVLLK